MPPQTVSYDRSAFHSTAAPKKRLSFRELAGMLDQSGGPATGRGTMDGDEVGYGGGYAAHIVDAVAHATGVRMLELPVTPAHARAHGGHLTQRGLQPEAASR